MKKLFLFLFLPATVQGAAFVGSAGSGGNITVTIQTDMVPGSTHYIQNRDTLQSGATFYVSSGTIMELRAANLERPGEINNSTNPVDFSQLKNVPAQVLTGGGGVGGGSVAIYTGAANVAVTTTSFPGATITSDGSFSTVTYMPAIASTNTAFQTHASTAQTAIHLVRLATGTAQVLAFTAINSTDTASKVHSSTSQVMMQLVRIATGTAQVLAFTAINSTDAASKIHSSTAQIRIAALAVDTTTLLGLIGGGSGGTDNLGSHVSTRVLNANQFGIVGSSVLAVGTTDYNCLLCVSSASLGSYSPNFVFVTSGNPLNLTETLFQVRRASTTIQSSTTVVKGALEVFGSGDSSITGNLSVAGNFVAHGSMTAYGVITSTSGFVVGWSTASHISVSSGFAPQTSINFGDPRYGLYTSQGQLFYALNGQPVVKMGDSVTLGRDAGAFYAQTGLQNGVPEFSWLGDPGTGLHGGQSFNLGLYLNYRELMRLESQFGVEPLGYGSIIIGGTDAGDARVGVNIGTLTVNGEILRVSSGVYNSIFAIDGSSATMYGGLQVKKGNLGVGGGVSVSSFMIGNVDLGVYMSTVTTAIAAGGGGGGGGGSGVSVSSTALRFQNSVASITFIGFSSVTFQNGGATVTLRTSQKLEPEVGQFRPTNYPAINVSTFLTFPESSLLFDSGLSETAYWKESMGNYLPGSSITINLYWRADNPATTSGNVQWGVQIATLTPNISPDDSLTESFVSTHAVVTGHLGTVARRLHKTSISFGGPDLLGLLEGGMGYFAIHRNGNDAADTLVGDVALVYATCEY